MIEIRPLQGETDQWIDEVFDDLPVSLRIKWNERFQYFTLSIFHRNRNVIVEGIKLLRDHPLVGKLQLTEFPGELLCVRNYGSREKPDFFSFPDEFSIYYLGADDLATLGISD